MTANLPSHLHYIHTGHSGSPPVVLVHPIGLDLTYWADQIEALCDDFDVIAYDIAGHGASAPSPSDYSLRALSGHLGDLIVGIGAGPAVVVGLSVGGMLAQQLACVSPQLVRALVLMDTACTFSDAARTNIEARGRLTIEGGMEAIVAPTLDRWFTPFFQQRRPDVLDRVRRTLLQADAHVHAAMWGGIAKLDLAEAIRVVRCPALVLVGEDDPTTPVSASKAICENMASARLQIVPGASHLPTLERPAEVNRHILSFLRSIA